MTLTIQNYRISIALLLGLASLTGASAQTPTRTLNAAGTPALRYGLPPGRTFSTRGTFGIPVRQPVPARTPRPTPPPSTPPPRPPASQPVGQVFIRGLPYEDHSANTRLGSSTVQAGQSFRIESTSLPLDGQIRVTMQDVNRGNGFGVTAYQLTNVRRAGNALIVQAPNLPVLTNRTYHIAVFVYGSTNRTANAGRLTIR